MPYIAPHLRSSAGATTAAHAEPLPPPDLPAPKPPFPPSGVRTPHSVVAVITDTTGSLVLVQRRLVGHCNELNRLEFPGGGIDSTDATPLDACLREIGEECGAAMKDAVSCAAKANLAFEVTKVKKNLWERRVHNDIGIVHIFTARIPNHDSIVMKPNKEAVDHQWIPISTIPELGETGVEFTGYTTHVRAFYEAGLESEDKVAQVCAVSAAHKAAHMPRSEASSWLAKASYKAGIESKYLCAASAAHMLTRRSDRVSSWRATKV